MISYHHSILFDQFSNYSHRNVSTHVVQVERNITQEQSSFDTSSFFTEDKENNIILCMEH